MLNWIVLNIIYIKMDLSLNNLQRLICHKTQQTKQTKPLISENKNWIWTNSNRFSRPAMNNTIPGFPLHVAFWQSSVRTKIVIDVVVLAGQIDKQEPAQSRRKTANKNACHVRLGQEIKRNKQINNFNLPRQHLGWKMVRENQHLKLHS